MASNEASKLIPVLRHERDAGRSRVLGMMVADQIKAHALRRPSALPRTLLSKFSHRRHVDFGRSANDKTRHHAAQKMFDTPRINAPWPGSKRAFHDSAVDTKSRAGCGGGQ